MRHVWFAGVVMGLGLGASAALASEDDETTSPGQLLQEIPAAGSEAASSDETVDATPSLRVVYSGGFGGIGGGRYRFESQVGLSTRLAEQERTVREIDVLHGVLVQANAWFWADDGNLTSGLALVGDGEPTCDAPVAVQVMQTPTELIVSSPSAPLLRPLDSVVADTWLWQRCTAGDVSGVMVRSGPPDVSSRSMTWSAEAFEVRLGFRWHMAESDDVLMQLGRPRREAGRRVAALRARLQAGEAAIYVDAGGFLDGVNLIDGGSVSRHRQNGLEILHSLNPEVLVPGASELAVGLTQFFDERAALDLPYVATNWNSENERFSLPQSHVHRWMTPAGEKEVMFLGIVDPAVALQVAGLGVDGVTITDPVRAVHDVIDPLISAGTRPDAVIVLADASPALQAALRGALHGVDLLIGDPTAATYRVESQTVALRDVPAAYKAAPFTLPMDGLAEARLTWDERGPVGLEVTPVVVSADDPQDAAVTSAITKVRAELFPGRESVLVPVTSDTMLTGVPDDTWSKLVCEAMLTLADGDAAFLDALPPQLLAPGPLTELLASHRLAVNDLLEVHYVDGNRMRDFLRTADGVAPIQCGATMGAGYQYARGRPLDEGRTYRVVTTDRTRLVTALGPLLAGGSSDLVGHRPKYRPIFRDGEPLTLQHGVLEQLRAWRDAASDDPSWVSVVEGRSARDKPPQWLVRLRRLALTVQRFQGPANPAYAEVPETLINSPSSFTLGGDVDLALDYSSADVAIDVRARAAYTRLVVDDADPLETADDWRLSSSLSLPIARFPRVGKLRMMPYGEVLYDSEFTPALDENGAARSLQSDLSLTVGLSALRTGWLRMWRVGAFVSRDMMRLQDKFTEYGGRLELETWHQILPLSAIRFETLWDLQVFGDTPADDAADLRLRLAMEGRLKFRVYRWMNLSLFASGLVVQGRVPETQRVASSVTFGAALDLSSVFLIRR